MQASLPDLWGPLAPMLLQRQQPILNLSISMEHTTITPFLLLFQGDQVCMCGMSMERYENCQTLVLFNTLAY